MKRSTLLIALLVLAAVYLAACGENVNKKGMMVSQAHIYLPASGTDGTSISDVAAAFMQIDNYTTADDRLIGARADFATAQIHEMKMEGDVMKMFEVAGIDIPADSGIELKSGGYHVMLMGLNGSIKIGDTKNITLIFEKAGEVTVPMLVTAEE